MSLQICTAEFLASDSLGTEFTGAWIPTMAAERMATSSRDGSVERAPDQVPFIESDLLWTNTHADPVYAMMSVHRASRFLLTSNPNTLVLDDAWTFDVGLSPAAPLPFGTGNGVGVRLKNRRSFESLLFSRMFRDFPDWVSYVPIGLVNPEETVQFRYRCLFSTPGEWRTAVQPRHEVAARWTRLRLWTSPYVAGVV